MGSPERRVLMVKLRKMGKETLENYNELLKDMYVDKKLELLDRAIVQFCGVKLHDFEKLHPILKGICEGFHKDQVTLKF